MLAFARGGIPEVVGPDCARLVDAGDVPAAAALVPEAAALDRRAARDHAVRHCSIEVMVDAYLALLEEARMACGRVIGYYVHHQGAGHLRRMESIAPHSHQDVTVLSSLPRPASYRGEWVRLAPDDQDPDPRDVTAGGTLHWAPRHDAGLARRSAQILAWLADARPALVVVDVSVEVALLVRLAGVPVVVAAMRGDRSDRPHVTAYDLADALLAPWSVEVPAPWPQRWLDKTAHVGALSRFDGRERPAPRVSTGRPRALLLWGEGGGGPSEQDIAAMRAATPDWDWELAHPGSRLDPDGSGRRCAAPTSW